MEAVNKRKHKSNITLKMLSNGKQMPNLIRHIPSLNNTLPICHQPAIMS